MKRWFNIGVVLALAAVSVAALEPEQRARFGVSTDGLADVLPTTAWAAFKVWAFWALAGAVLAALLLRFEPELGLLDATLGGLAGVWIFANLGANLLGPVGLYRAWVVWSLLWIGMFWCWYRAAPVTQPSWSTGGRLALLAFGLLGPTALLLQLGAPVPSFMDVLATPAAAQRIATFGYYLPFDSDPYGYWTTTSQLPGLEVFYGLLALGSGSSGVLADTAANVPMLALLLFGTYRLGRTMADDVTGGFACLLVAATVLPRVLPYGHGRSTSFVLVAVGLAFLFDERKSVVRATLGALALATAFATHAGVGILALATAALGLRGWYGLSLLTGVVLLCLPAVAVLIGTPLPYPVLPAAQFAGLAVILTTRRFGPASPRGWWERPLLAAVAIAVLWHPAPYIFANEHATNFPLLAYAGGLGFAVAVFDRSRPLVLIALGLTVAFGIEAAYAMGGREFLHNPVAQVGFTSLAAKIGYWIPYLLVFPAGYLASRAYERAPSVTVLVVLALLLFPWRERLYPIDPGAADPNYHQVALAEHWAYQAETGLSGFWGGIEGGAVSRRWAQSPAELAAIDALRDEIRAGRVTTDTHLALLAPFTYLFKDNFLAAVYTGINVDGYLTRYRFDNSIAGSRLRPIEEWPARLASDPPPYIAVHVRDDPTDPENVDPRPFVGRLDGYTELFNQGNIRLLRRNDD